MHLNLSKQSAMAAFAMLFLSAAATASAQTETSTFNPATAKPVTLTYRSELENYQRYSESTLLPWRQSNDTVKDIGGWRAYAKEMTKEEAREPDGQKSPQDANHGGHR